MAQYPEKDKLKSIYEIQLQNKIDLDRKDNKNVSRYINKISPKLNRTLYDSGWVSTEPEEYGQEYASVWFNYNVSGSAFPNIGTMKVGCSFKKIINIPEYLLPYIKATIMTKHHPRVTPIGFYTYTRDIYHSPYWRVKGDSTLLIQETGYPIPYQYLWTQADISNGKILASLTSKWFRGDIDWKVWSTVEDDYIEYRMEEARIISITSYFDYSYTPGGGEDPPHIQYKIFECPALDSLTGGTGTYTIVDSDAEEDVVEKNVTMSFPALVTSQATIITLEGKAYEKFPGEDEVYLGIKEGTAYDGFIDSLWSGIPEFKDPDHPSEITDFSFEPYTDSGGGQYYRLWYSNKRATYFDMDTVYNFKNLPVKESYEGDILPYTELTVEINPGSLPGSSSYNYDVITGSNNTDVSNFIKMGEEKYMCSYSGLILFTVPREDNRGVSVPYVDETWIKSEGDDTYEKEETNRPGKTKNYYYPNPEIVQVRLLLTLQNPGYFNVTERNIIK